MKRTLIAFLGWLLLCGGALFPWGAASHLYIDEQIARKAGRLQENMGYGGAAADAFNYLFASPYLEEMYAATHYQFEAVWDAVRNRIESTLALGFASHNDAWGADYTAHHAGVILGMVGVAEGYVIAKAKALLEQAPLPPELPLSQEQSLSLYHEFVETAVNVLMKRIDPQIGDKLGQSALRRSPDFPAMLAAAYGQDFAPFFGGQQEAERAIIAAESEFRKIMILLGQTLSQDESTAVGLLSEQMAAMAEGFLGAPLPIPQETAVALISQLVTAAIQLCQDDYAQELQATAEQVGAMLAVSGYTLPGFKPSASAAGRRE